MNIRTNEECKHLKNELRKYSYLELEYTSSFVMILIIMIVINMEIA